MKSYLKFIKDICQLCGKERDTLIYCHSGVLSYIAWKCFNCGVTKLAEWEKVLLAKESRMERLFK